MNLMPFPSAHLLVQQLRKANQTGWLYATDVCLITDDKAGFDAIGLIGGVDDKLEFNTTLIKKT